MNNKLFAIFFLISVGIVGCQNNNQKGQSTDDTQLAKTAQVENNSIMHSKCDTLYSNEFSDQPLAFEVFKADTNSIKSLFLDPVTLTIETKQGKQGGTYNLYNFTDGKNKIILFKNDGGFYLDDVDINSGRLLLNKKISIGMKRNTFLGLLKAKNNIDCDTIHVVSEEATVEMKYIFINDELRQIKEVNYFAED